MSQAALFDLEPTRMPCTSCDALAVLAAPYRVGTAINQRWRCGMCGTSGLISTKVPQEAAENEGVAEVIIGKQRNGPIGTVKLAFLKPFTRFENLA